MRPQDRVSPRPRAEVRASLGPQEIYALEQRVAIIRAGLSGTASEAQRNEAIEALGGVSAILSDARRV